MQILKKIDILERKGLNVIDGLTKYGFDGLEIANQIGTTYSELESRGYKLNLPKLPKDYPKLNNKDKAELRAFKEKLSNLPQGETIIYHKGNCPQEAEFLKRAIFYEVYLRYEIGYLSLTQTKDKTIFVYKAKGL